MPLGIAAMSQKVNEFKRYFPSFLAWLVSNQRHETAGSTPIDIIFSSVNRFDPIDAGDDPELQTSIIKQWAELYPAIINGVLDSDGYPPKNTWFCPADESLSEILHPLLNLCDNGFGEMEVMIDIGGEPAVQDINKLARIIEKYRHNGIPELENRNQTLNFAIITAVKEPIAQIEEREKVRKVLTSSEDLGGYADFTSPVHSMIKRRKLNRIYDLSEQSRGPDKDEVAKSPGENSRDPGLFLNFPGPLFFNYENYSLLPYMDNAEISSEKPFERKRVENWIKANVHVAGKPEWLFLRTSTRGAKPDIANMLLGDDGRQMYMQLVDKFSYPDYRLHFVTAREAYNIAAAAIDGHGGNPNDYRDYKIKPYSLK